MKQFIAFVKKEFYHIFRDRRTMLILLGMPVVQIILFGFAISTEVKNVRLAVLDPSNDVVTRKIIDRLDASEYFTVTRRFHSPREMEAAFLKNKIDMVVVFNEHFADGLYCGDARVQLIVDATDPNMSTSQINYATGIVSAVGQVGGGVFAVYFCLVVVGIADFIGNTYTSGGYAGFRHDSDDAYHGVVRYDFPCGEYAVDSSVDIGYYSGPLVYPGCT